MKIPVKDIRLNIVIPNVITLAAAAAGMTSLKYTVEGNFSFAIIAILVAALLDGLDGRVARLMRGGSDIGVQLDSLSDFLNFGVAPGFLLYYFSLHQLGAAGWAITLLFMLCCEFRLARFNAMTTSTPPVYWSNFFTGLPAPGGGVASLAPVMLFIASRQQWQWLTNPAIIAATTILCGLMMASRIPTLSIKKIKIKEGQLPLFFITCFVFISALFTAFWWTLGIGGVIYLGIIPFTIWKFKKLKKAFENEQTNSQGN